jgi:hypothetical protein
VFRKPPKGQPHDRGTSISGRAPGGWIALSKGFNCSIHGHSKSFHLDALPRGDVFLGTDFHTSGVKSPTLGSSIYPRASWPQALVCGAAKRTFQAFQILLDDPKRMSFEKVMTSASTPDVANQRFKMSKVECKVKLHKVEAVSDPKYMPPCARTSDLTSAPSRRSDAHVLTDGSLGFFEGFGLFASTIKAFHMLLGALMEAFLMALHLLRSLRRSLSNLRPSTSVNLDELLYVGWVMTDFIGMFQRSIGLLSAVCLLRLHRSFISMNHQRN